MVRQGRLEVQLANKFAALGTDDQIQETVEANEAINGDETEDNIQDKSEDSFEALVAKTN